MIIKLGVSQKNKEQDPGTRPCPMVGETLQGDEKELNIAPRLPEETITHVSRSCKRILEKTSNPLQRDSSETVLAFTDSVGLLLSFPNTSGENILFLLIVREKIC